MKTGEWKEIASLNIIEVVPCARCGCVGNESCGHEPLDSTVLCTLGADDVCGCCRANRGGK